ncbi:MAG: RsmD family RNA methyltransferase [Opitutales bacterium]|jgi:16S rRNA (guanine966-N2)-methyltransferase
MRISGGEAKGIPLRTPKGGRLRPASETGRQRLFSSIGHLISGACFLDLFAGTGSYGLEAASRGASRGTFVEKDGRTAQCLRDNLANVCKSAKIDCADFAVVEGDALRARVSGSGPFDLIFADPPYSFLESIAPKLFARLLEDGVAKKETLVILELPGERHLEPQGWVLERRLGKGRKGAPDHALFRMA